MTAKKKFRTYTKWLIPLFLITFLLVIAVIDQTATSQNASASKQDPASFGYAGHPSLKEVSVEKNLVYSDMENSLLDIYYPENATGSMPVILWIHGGGYIGGSKDSRQQYGMNLASAGYVVANIDYALAPEYRYPGPIHQANAALEYLQVEAAKYGGDMSRVFIGGDSAGAQISSQVAAMLSNDELAAVMDIVPALQSEHLRGAVLFCGLFNMETVRATEFPNIDLFLAAYTGTEPFESFSEINELSTINHITSDYPPVFVTVGDADPFSSQSAELVQVLESQNVPVDSVFFDGSYKNLKHEYQYELDTVEAQETLEKTLDFLFVNSN